MQRRSAVLLLILSIAVLAVGATVRHRTPAPKPAAAPVDLEILQRLTADRRLRDLSAYLAEKAHSAARRLTPSGLAWDTGAVLAPSGPAPDVRGLPFTVRREDAASNLPPAVPARPRAGDWLIAVARAPGGETIFAHGLFEGIAKERCGSFDYEAVHLAAPLAPTMIGGGVFLLDGTVAAFIAACGGRPIAIASSTIADVLAHPPTPADLLEQQYGFRLAQDPPGLVTAVWEGSDAERAGLRPGDLVDPNADPPAQARRRGRTVTLDWLDERPLPPPPTRGITFDGPAVVAVAPGTPAAAAGILVGDRVVRVADASVADPGRVIDRSKGPVVVTVERDGRRRETLLQP